MTNKSALRLLLRLGATLVSLALCLLPERGWSFALGATAFIDLNGSYISSDSFDSGDPLYSTNGRYDPAKRKDNGDIVTSRGLLYSLSIGNARIMGHVRTGPGTNTFTIGPTGSVGDLEWVQSGMMGIKPGWASADWTAACPDVVLPVLNWVPAVPGSYNINGTNYQYAFLTSGDFVAATVSGSIFVGSNAFVRLKVTGNVVMNGPGLIALGGTNAHLDLYMGGPSFTIGTVLSASGNANDFHLFGLFSNFTIEILGGAFTGTIYAPSADLTVFGAGNNIYDFIGSSLTRSVTVNGHIAFHYDEQLAPPYPPSISRQPQDQNVLAGQAASFEVTALGYGTLAYQWRFNGLPLAGATKSNLTISNVAALDAGLYSVVVTNRYGSATSSNATLTVNYPPSTLQLGAGLLPGQIRFDLLGAPGLRYAIEASTDLQSWSLLVTNAAPFTYSEEMGDRERRFYRAVLVPW